MPTSEPTLCYGEPLPIARGLAMDAALPRRTLSDIFGSPRRSMARDEAPNEDPMDYTKLLAFLREKLDADDLRQVASMLGVEVDTTGMDRRRGTFRGASDGRAAAPSQPVRYDPATFPHASRLKF